MSFVDAYQDRFGGVEPICRVLCEHGWQIAPSGYWAAKARPTSARDIRDDQLVKIIYEIRAEDFNEVYGPRKMWRELGRRGQRVARCTVERLMGREGLSGAVRGRTKIRTTVADPSHERAADLVRRVPGVQEAFIYGSWAARRSGEPGAFPNDIDVMVIGDLDVDAVVDIQATAREQLGVAVNIHRSTAKAWQHRDGNPFLENLASRSRTPLAPKEAAHA